jgi:uncharacterized protein
MIPLRRPGAEVGDRHELQESFEVPPFDLYGRRHDVDSAQATVAVTRLAEGVHLDLAVRVTVLTTCDRTLKPTELVLEFGDSEFLSGPSDSELSVRDWELDVRGYTEHALPNEVPMQVFCPGTQPVRGTDDGGDIDPRWKGLGDLFASGF